MSDHKAPVLGTDKELLALARAVLQEHDYSMEDLQEGELTLALAENPYFIVAVVATPTFESLLQAEDTAEGALLNRLAEKDVGAKAYDVYLILLTQERLPVGRGATREFFAITHDTRMVRRIIHTGVEPTMAYVRSVLVPFVPPRQLQDAETHVDSLVSLSSALVNRGMDVRLVDRSIRAFREGVAIDNAIP